MISEESGLEDEMPLACGGGGGGGGASSSRSSMNSSILESAQVFRARVEGRRAQRVGPTGSTRGSARGREKSAGGARPFAVTLPRSSLHMKGRIPMWC